MDRTELLQRFAKHLGYSEAQAAALAADGPRARFVEALSAASAEYLFVAEVLRAEHCNSGYRPGDRFVLDAAGNLISKRCPQRLCVFLVSQLALPVALMNERLCAGLEPSGIFFMRQTRCLDTGVACKGYGEVLVEVRAVLRRDFLKAGTDGK